MTYTIDIEGYKMDLPLCKLADDFYIGAYVMFGDVELTKHCAEKLLEKAPEFDYILGPEAKVIPLIYEMSRQSGKKYFVARKKEKAYMTDVLKVNVNSITSKFVQTLILDGNDAKELKGKRVILVDDVISTGESLRAVEALADAAGAVIVAKMTPVAEGDAFDRDDIIALAKLPLFNADGTIKNI